jgi:hypothetical protein
MRVDLIVLCMVPCVTGAAAAAWARGSDCSSPQPPSIGASIGRSDPYLELRSAAVDVEPPDSVSVRAGAQLAGRADLPLAGPLRLRLEGATARWDVRVQRYDPDAGYRVIADESVGHMTSRHFVALVGLTTGRAPACAHVSAGGGFYSIGFRGDAVRSLGLAIGAGMEIRTGSTGAIQLDATVHMIDTRSRDPIAFSTVDALNLTVGWTHRF